MSKYKRCPRCKLLLVEGTIKEHREDKTIYIKGFTACNYFFKKENRWQLDNSRVVKKLNNVLEYK